jgi:hypothetical protein
MSGTLSYTLHALIHQTNALNWSLFEQGYCWSSISTIRSQRPRFPNEYCHVGCAIVVVYSDWALPLSGISWRIPVPSSVRRVSEKLCRLIRSSRRCSHRQVVCIQFNSLTLLKTESILRKFQNVMYISIMVFYHLEVEACLNIFQMSTNIRGFQCSCKVTNIFCILILVTKVDIRP